MKLRYTPQARNDLRNFKQYISAELCNPQAAERVTKRIVKDCSNLKSNSFLGPELKNKLDVDIDLRYLISSNYIVFYRINDDVISIIRICDARTNYISVLFED